VKINKLSILKLTNDEKYQQNQPLFWGISCPHLAPLKQDAISFKGNVLKKTDFKGIDFTIIEKYKINPQQLKSKAELQDIAKEKIDELDKEYVGRQEKSTKERKIILKEWFDYVIEENKEYSNTQKLIILSAIVKDLKQNNDKIPPMLNKDILANTMQELETKLKTNPQENFDFNKMYQKNLRNSFLSDTESTITITGWIVIPSKINDPKNFKKNVEKVKALSHKNWCTKNSEAEPYLSEGDFYIYFEDGQPKLGMRIINNKIGEIQGEKNNGKISLKYLQTIKNFKKTRNIDLQPFVKEQINIAKWKSIKLNYIKFRLGKNFQIDSIDKAKKVLDLLNIPTIKTKDGLIIDGSYSMDSLDICFDDLNLDENDLFKFITEIKNDAIFADSNLSNLGALKKIGRNAYFSHSNISNLNNLKTINGDAFFDFSPISNLADLETIGGDARFEMSNILNLGKLKTIAGNVYLGNGSKLKRNDFINIDILGNFK